MKKNESKATKPALKSTPGKKKKATAEKAVLPVKKGRGGARPGTGPKPRNYEYQQTHIDLPLAIIEAIEEAKIENKTAFFIVTAAKELKNLPAIKKNAKLKFALEKIITDPKIFF